MAIIFVGTEVKSLKRRHTIVTRAEARIFPVIFDKYFEETKTINRPSRVPAMREDMLSQIVPPSRMAKHPAPSAVAKICKDLDFFFPSLMVFIFSITSSKVYWPLHISRDSWFISITFNKSAPWTGTCSTFAKHLFSFPSNPVVKMPLDRTKKFPSFTPKALDILCIVSSTLNISAPFSSMIFPASMLVSNTLFTSTSKAIVTTQWNVNQRNETCH